MYCIVMWHVVDQSGEMKIVLNIPNYFLELKSNSKPTRAYCDAMASKYVRIQSITKYQKIAQKFSSNPIDGKARLFLNLTSRRVSGDLSNVM